MSLESIGSVTTTAAADLTRFTVTQKTPPAKLTGAALRNAEPAEQRAAVAAQFEAILVRQLLGKTMNSMLGGEDGGVSSSIYGDMLADTIANQLTAGPGLGLGRTLMQQLTPKGEKTTDHGPQTTQSLAAMPGVSGPLSVARSPSTNP